MKTETNRDILSSNDIAATCGDADCAASDADMTPADEAMVAQVAAEVLTVAPSQVALTLADMKALPGGTKLARLDADRATIYAKFDVYATAYAWNADGSKVKGGRKIDWKPGRFALAA